MNTATARVALLKSSDSAEAIAATLDELLRLLGSPLETLRAGDVVLIKPNMFQHKPGFLSNPHLVTAIAAAVAARGAKPVVAERTHAIYQLLADSPVHRYAEVVSFDDRPLRIVQIDGATSLRVPIALPDIVLDCDYFIGVPQLRTHSSVVMTGAMKNLIGLLPGYTTRVVHMAGVDESLVDLNIMRPQDLVVVDAINVIEGNYPMAGVARPVGLLAAGTNAVAVDTVLAEVAGIDVDELSYLRDAAGRGLGPARVAEIELCGAPIPEVAFAIERAPRAVIPPRPGVHLHIDTACAACRRWVAAAMVALKDEILSYPGELTVISGPRERLPDLRGAVVLVGNALYEHREAGVYLEGCPPRAIQLAGFRYAMGQQVGQEQRTQFRVPGDIARGETLTRTVVGDDV